MHPAAFIILFISVFVAVLLLAKWLHSKWNQIDEMLDAPHTVRNKPYPFEKQNNLEPLPPNLQNVNPDMEPLVRAIHSSVKRYKDQFQSCYRNSYHCTVRSKRYELKISLTKISGRKYSLHLDLEGKHPHELSLEYSGMMPPKFRNKDSEITKEELEPFMKPLSFFTTVETKPDILTAYVIVQTNDSMEDWPQVLSAFIRLARYLMDSAIRKEILETADVLCPYCRGEFNQSDATVSCSECKTRHHQECWDEVQRCSVFGCRNKTEIVITT